MVKTTPKPQAGSETHPNTSQPLFFRNPQPVDAKRHAAAGIRRDVGFGFARDTNSIPITIHEFVEVARSCPIVFTNEAIPMPLALVGLRNRNRFVDESGRWAKGHYIPGYVRKYPFALLEVAEKKQFILCIDEGAPHFQPALPEQPLYDNGEAAAAAKEAIEECSRQHSQFLGTREFGAMLRDAGILEQKEMHAELPNKESFAIGGFQLISEEKWNALSDKEFLRWRTKQWAGLIYLVMASQVNWKYLGGMEAEG